MDCDILFDLGVNGVLLSDYDSNRGLSQFVCSVERHPVREVRMSQSLFLQLANGAEFQNAFDPTAVADSVASGYMGTLYGVRVTVVNQKSHREVTPWPHDKLIMFY